MDDDPTTEELRAEQLLRERLERRAADADPDPDASDQHAARADKAAYLRERLEQRARAEREAGERG